MVRERTQQQQAPSYWVLLACQAASGGSSNPHGNWEQGSTETWRLGLACRKCLQCQVAVWGLPPSPSLCSYSPPPAPGSEVQGLDPLSRITQEEHRSSAQCNDSSCVTSPMSTQGLDTSLLWGHLATLCQEQKISLPPSPGKVESSRALITDPGPAAPPSEHRVTASRGGSACCCVLAGQAWHL